MAMAKQQKIEFSPEWFKIDSDETPEGTKPKQADEIKESGSGRPQQMA
jgi:hypothetical protein